MAPKAFVPLRDEEIEELYNDFDHDQDGRVSFKDLEATLKSIYDEIAPVPQRHHLTHPDRSTIKAKIRKSIIRQRTDPTPSKAISFARPDRRSDLHDFLCRLLPDCGDSMSKRQFCKQIRSWNIPSQDQTAKDSKEHDARRYHRNLPLGRRWSAWWSVKGPEMAFLAVVLALVIGFSVWQGLKYGLNQRARTALSVGLVVAKFSAGAMYPTFFFLIVSMSRWLATLCRKSYLISRFVNWDHSRSFHIQMSCLALLLALTHTIGHLSGTFVYGSARSRQKHLKQYMGKTYVRRSYRDFV
jgi:respiratory burst oxidase